MTDTDERRVTAAHEAGHAIVMCAERNRWSGGVTIVPGPGYVGLCYLAGPYSTTCYVAGVVAERIVFGEWPPWWHGSTTDCERAARAEPDKIANAIQSAGDILHRNRLAFDHVTRKLVQRATIPAEDVRHAIVIWRDEQQPHAMWTRELWQPLFEHVLAVRAKHAAA